MDLALHSKAVGPVERVRSPVVRGNVSAGEDSGLGLGRETV